MMMSDQHTTDRAELYGVANCDHLQNLKAPPKPGRWPIVFLTHVDKKTTNACRLTIGQMAP